MRKITIVLTLFAAALALPLQAGVTLEGSTDALELVTSSTSAIDYACSWSNVTATALTTPGTTKGNIAAATTTTVIAAPAASNFRHVRKCWFHNDAGGSSNTLTVQIDVSATNRLLYAATLLAGEALSLTEDGDFILYDSTGQKKSLLVTGGGTEATALRVTVANDSTGVLSVDDNGGLLTVDGTVTVTDGAGALNVIVDSATLGTVTVSDGAGAMNVIVDSGAVTATVPDLTTSASLGALNNVVSLQLVGRVGAVATITGGTLSGTLVPELSSDNTTWVSTVFMDSTDGSYVPSVVTTGTPASYQIWVSAGYSYARVRVSLYTSGASTVNLVASSSGQGNMLIASIGSVGINEGVFPGSNADNLGKLEDNPHGTGDTGVLALAVRNDGASTTLTNLNGDYSPIATGSKGELFVSDGAGAMNTIVDSGTLTAVTSITNSVTVTDGAGAMNVIVDSSALPSGAATSALQDGIVKDGAGDTTQANVTTGRLSVDGSGVTQPVSGTVTAAQATASSLNAEVQGDAAHDATLSGNPVLMGGASSAAAPADVSADGEAVRAWHLRNGAAATVVTAAGALIGGDAANGLDVDVTRSALPSGASTSALQDGIIKDGAGDTTQANVVSGKLSVDPGTVTVTATNLDVQIGGSDTVTVAGNKTTNNAAPGATNVGALPAVAEAAAPSFTEGNMVALSTNLAGALRVTGGGGGTEYVTNAVAPADPTGTTLVSERDDQLATLTEVEGDWTNTRATSKGALWVAIPDTNGDPITSFGGGTEYNQGTVTTDTDTLKMAGAVRRDTAAVATGVIDGDRLALSTDSVGRLRTTGADTTQPVSGTVTVTDGAGALNVIVDSGTTVVTQPTATNLNAAVVGTGTAGAPAGNILTVQGVASMTKLLVTPDSVALPANQSVNVAQVAGTNTVTGGVAGIIAVGGNVANAVAATANPVPVGGIFTTAPATLTTGQTATMQFTAAQNLKHDVTTIAGTAPTTAGKLDVKAADGDVFVRQATATNLNAAVVGTGTAGAPAGNILTIQGVASMTKLLVTPDSVALPANQSTNIAQVAGTNTVTGGVAGIIAVGGNVANAVAATANPVPVGGIFTTVPATLTTGQTGTMQFTAAQNIKTDIATIAGTAPTTAGMVDVKINQTTTANDVDVASVVPGTGATNLGKAEDSGHGSTDTGVMALAVQQQADGTPTEFSATDLDYSPISVDSFGTMSGSLYMPWAWTYHENSSSALTDTTVHASCGSGLFNYIDTMTVSTGAATALNVFIEDSTTTTILGPYYLEAVAGRGFSVNFLPGKKQTTAATLIAITTSAAIAHGIDIQGHCGR